MNDLISRQAAIDVASGYCHPANIAKELAKLPSAQPTQTNTPNALKALDCVSRQAVRMIESSPDAYPEEWNDDYEKGFTDAVNSALSLPSAQPEIIYCKDCVKHNRDIGDFEEREDGRYWFRKYEACPMVKWRGKAQGHEFDYQFCVYAERRTDEQTVSE